MTTKDSNIQQTQPLLEDERLKNVSEGPNNKSEHDKPITRNNSSFCNSIVGFSLGLLASTIFTINGMLVQYFELDAVDTVTVRSILQVVFLGIVIKLKGKTTHTNRMSWNFRSIAL